MSNQNTEGNLPLPIELAFAVLMDYATSNSNTDALVSLQNAKQQLAACHAACPEEEPKGEGEACLAMEAISLDDSRKVGQLVRETMCALSAANYGFDEAVLAGLLNKEISNALFGINYAFLRRIENVAPISEQAKDKEGRNRYWTMPFSFNGVQYLVTSQWYAHNKRAFISWYNNTLANGVTACIPERKIKGKTMKYEDLENYCDGFGDSSYDDAFNEFELADEGEEYSLYVRMLKFVFPELGVYYRVGETYCNESDEDYDEEDWPISEEYVFYDISEANPKNFLCSFSNCDPSYPLADYAKKAGYSGNIYSLELVIEKG